MSDDQRLLAWLLCLNSVLYLSGCFVAGLLVDSPWAWKLALLAFGLNYFAYSARLLAYPRAVSAILVLLSFLAGVAAGLFLLR